MDLTPDNAAPAAPDTGGDTRAALVAELEALGATDAAPAAPPAADTPDGDAEAPGESAPGTDDDSAADEPEADGDAEDTDAEDAEPDAEAADPELAKRLEAIQRAEKRSRDQVEQARRELDAERQRIEQQLAPQREALAKYEAARKRAKYDPVSVLSSLGLSADDFEAAARQVYAASTAGQANPQLRDQAARSLREREASDEIAQLRQQHEQLQAQIQADRSQRELASYLDTVGRSVTAATPLVSALVTNDPSGAREELARVAEQLYQASGEVPDPADVAAELEKTERARLKRLGIEAPAAGKRAATKTPTPDSGENKPGKTLTNNMAATPATPRHEPQSEPELREDILAHWPG